MSPTVNKTGYYTHRDCWKHEMGVEHPECSARLDAIEDRLLMTGVGDALERREAPLASLTDVELAHDRMHVAALRGLTDRLVDIAAGQRELPGTAAQRVGALGEEEAGAVLAGCQDHCHRSAPHPW